MSILTGAKLTRPAYTSTSLGATGATSLVSAPGSNNSLVIDFIHIVNQTNTTGQVEITLREGAAGSTHLRTYSFSLGAAPIDQLSLDVPLVVDSNAALQVVCSVTAASTPSTSRR